MDRVLVGVLLAWTAVAASGESKTLQKAPVPDATALEASQQAARDLFGDRFRSAKTVTAKTAVAAEMIEAALKLQDGSADQYVLLKIAREIAIPSRTPRGKPCPESTSTGSARRSRWSKF